MADHDDRQGREKQLRQLAEELLDYYPAGRLETPDSVLELVEELKVRQIEFEMQNAELKRAQQELNAVFNEYLDLYDFAPCAYLTLNSSGLLTRINLTGANLFGVDRYLLKFTPFNRLIHKGSQDAYWAALRLAGRTGSGQSVELECIRQDKSLFWVQAQIQVDLNEAWEVMQWRLTLLDITERVKASKTLIRSERHFRLLFEHTPLPCQSLDEKGRLLEVNRKWLDTMGYPKKDVIGTWFGNYVDPGLLAQFQQQFALLPKEGVLDSVELTLIKRSGERIVVYFNASAQFDEDGGFHCAHGVFTDITEHRNLEAQLLQAQKMQAVGTLAGGVAHNFNNVLMGISGRATLLMMDKDSSHADLKHLKGIEEDVRRAAELTNDLLGYAREGKNQVELIDLNELIPYANEMFSHTNKKIVFNETYKKGLWTVSVDPGQLRQVLMNLYLNAGQAMPDGGEISIQTDNCRLSDDHQLPFRVVPGRYVKISVADTGVGMDEITRQKIFEPFFTTQEVGKGTGLGLASVYGIVKNHGGFITVSSEPGQGSRFDIYLPASRTEAPSRAEAKVEQQIVQYGQGTLLLVDDEDHVLEVTRKLLEGLGYTVLGAGSGQAALDVYQRHSSGIDLVILDMIMPGMGGKKIYNRLKEMDPGVKVLLSSGYYDTEEVQAVLDLGCNSFIQKPFDWEELSQKVKEAIRAGKSETR
ncbi:MAG: response regulator [Desulfohalobiaceae bacterium]|nr:response regulator [Desulfohalobiaceae bacterium]